MQRFGESRSGAGRGTANAEGRWSLLFTFDIIEETSVAGMQ